MEKDKSIKILKPVLKFYLKNKLNIDMNIGHINIYGETFQFFAYKPWDNHRVSFWGSFINEESYWMSMNDYNQYVSEYRESQIEKILD
jgi:hypothetical protein